MIPSLFFAERKHPSNPNLKMEEEARLNQIFCELYSEMEEIKGKRGRRISYEIEDSLESEDLNKALPSGFFNPYTSLFEEEILKSTLRSSTKKGRKRIQGTKTKINEPLVVCEDLNAMFKTLLQDRLNPHERRELMVRLVRKLNKAGFKVEGFSDKQVLDVFRMFIEETIEGLTERPASLNCYDYIRLKDEIKRIEVLTEVDINQTCPTIVELIKEVEEAETSGSNYPIRPFPFDKVKAKSPWAYQCLRILDEILYTARHPLSTIEIQAKIKEKCKEYGIIHNQTVSTDSLKKHFSTLRNMINVEYTGGFRKAYQRDVYVEIMHGHKYDLIRNRKQPVTAFKLCFSLGEALKMQCEINILLNRLIDTGRILNRNEFAEEYPLLDAIAKIDTYDPSLTERSPKLKSHDGKQNSSIYILNYLPPVEAATKREVEKALKSEPKKIISIEDGKKEGKYLPIVLNEEGLDWALLARDVQTGLLHQLAPIDFGRDFSLEDSDLSYLFYEPIEGLTSEDLKGMMGLGDFYFERQRYIVSIDLSIRGYNILREDSHPLHPLIKKIYKTYEKEHPCIGVAEFDVFVNDDILEEIYRLDRKRYITDMYSKEVDIKTAYKNFLMRKGYDTKICKLILKE